MSRTSMASISGIVQRDWPAARSFIRFGRFACAIREQAIKAIAARQVALIMRLLAHRTPLAPSNRKAFLRSMFGPATRQNAFKPICAAELMG